MKWLIGLSGFKRSALHGNWHNFRPRATFPTIFGAYELALNPPTQRAWCRDHRARAFTRILKVARVMRVRRVRSYEEGRAEREHERSREEPHLRDLP